MITFNRGNISIFCNPSYDKNSSSGFILANLSLASSRVNILFGFLLHTLHICPECLEAIFLYLLDHVCPQDLDFTIASPSDLVNFTNSRSGNILFKFSLALSKVSILFGGLQILQICPPILEVIFDRLPFHIWPHLLDCTSVSLRLFS